MMTVEEIYSKVATHMVRGLMVHEQLMNCYMFLGLSGYAKLHKKQYLSETKGYIKLCMYFSEHYRGIIKLGDPGTPDIIPASWYSNKKDGMDLETRVKCIRAAFDEWVDWETETLRVYEKAYQDLLSLGEVSSSEFIRDYVKDVDRELIWASEERLKKYAIGFDIVSIVEEQ